MWATDDPIPADWGSGYPAIAPASGEELLYYQTFGSYQGEWIMLSRKGDDYLIRKNSYGSCSGCDSWESEEPRTVGQMRAFAAKYQPFVEVPRDTMAGLAEGGVERMGQVFPANIRDEYSDVDYPTTIREMTLTVRLLEGIAVTAEDIFGCRNLEIKRRALDQYGLERFLKDMDASEIDRAGENALLKVRDHVYLHLKDSSTPRRYLLRTDPKTVTVRAGIAASFGLAEKDYVPEVET